MEIKVLKRNDKLERLNTIKLNTSIKNTALDVNLKLSDKEIKLIVVEILRRLDRLIELKCRGKAEYLYISSFYELRGIILEVLKDMKYEKIALGYNGYN